MISNRYAAGIRGHAGSGFSEYAACHVGLHEGRNAGDDRYQDKDA